MTSLDVNTTTAAILMPPSSTTAITLPYDLIIEIAEFCFDHFDFQTLVNVSLCCHAVHLALRKTLEQKTLVWNADEVFEFCLEVHQGHDDFRDMVSPNRREQVK
jgi:hypothetical protein